MPAVTRDAGSRVFDASLLPREVKFSINAVARVVQTGPAALGLHLQRFVDWSEIGREEDSEDHGDDDRGYQEYDGNAGYNGNRGHCHLCPLLILLRQVSHRLDYLATLFADGQRVEKLDGVSAGLPKSLVNGIARHDFRVDCRDLIDVPGVLRAAKAQLQRSADVHAGVQRQVHRPCETRKSDGLKRLAKSRKPQHKALDGPRPDQPTSDCPDDKPKQDGDHRQEGYVDCESAVAHQSETEDIGFQAEDACEPDRQADDT